MRLEGIECPYCGDTNTRAYQTEKVCIWDNKFYECMKKEFGENQLKSNASDNIIYRCKCDNCEKHFSSMIEMNISVKNIISKESISELMNLKVNECS